MAAGHLYMFNSIPQGGGGKMEALTFFICVFVDCELSIYWLPFQLLLLKWQERNRKEREGTGSGKGQSPPHTPPCVLMAQNKTAP